MARSACGSPAALEAVSGGVAYAPAPYPLRIRISHVDPFGFFRRGDSNQDARHDLSDAIFTLDWLFRGGSGPSCTDAADSNDDGRIEISDAILSLGCLFLAGRCPPPPFPECWSDPTPDGFDCAGIGAGCL